MRVWVVGAWLILSVVAGGGCGGGDSATDVLDLGDSGILPDASVPDVPPGAGIDDARLPPETGGDDTAPDLPDAASQLPDAAPDLPPVACIEARAAEDCAGLEDGNPCSAPRCIDGTCHLTPTDAAFCDDGDPCTTGDHCREGGCVATGARDCDDGNECTIDACVPGEGCSSTPDPTCLPCQCLGDWDCLLDDPCSTVLCDVFSVEPCESYCVSRPLGGELDSPACVPYVCGEDAHCDDGNPCTVDRCLQAALDGEPRGFAERACAYEPVPQCEPPEALSCADDADCEVADCVPDSPLAACRAPTEGCPAPWCEPRLGCRYVPTADCPFAPECTPASQQSDCWDADPCSSDRCDPWTLRCSNPPVASDDFVLAGCGLCDTDEDCPAPGGWINGSCPTVRCLPFPEPNPLDPPSYGFCAVSAAGASPAPSCEDFDLCTTDSCLPGGGCRHEPTGPDCRYCGSGLDCDDGDPCTSDSCVAAPYTCQSEAIPGCERCEDSADCAPAGTCDFRYCRDGRCVSIPWAPPSIPGPHCTVRACASGVDCDDGDPATIDFCATGRSACLHLPDARRPGYECQWDHDCFTLHPCERADCVDGACLFEEIPGCVARPCAASDDCGDFALCTMDICLNGLCFNVDVSGDCCETTSDCAERAWRDGEKCGVPHCGADGRCRAARPSEAIRCGDFCESDEDCRRQCRDEAGICVSFCEPDGTCFDWPCAEGFCDAYGRCQWFDGDCRRCAADRDCLDGAPCTEDRCVDAVCTHTSLADCEPVACGAEQPCDSGDPCVLGVCLSSGCVWLPNPECDD